MASFAWFYYIGKHNTQTNWLCLLQTCVLMLGISWREHITLIKISETRCSAQPRRVMCQGQGGWCWTEGYTWRASRLYFRSLPYRARITVTTEVWSMLVHSSRTKVITTSTNARVKFANLQIKRDRVTKLPLFATRRYHAPSNSNFTD